MSDDDKERPKRNWREVDRMRDSGYRRAPLPTSQKTLKGQAAKRYRNQLDRIFSGGGLPEEVKRQAPSLAGVEKTDAQLRKDAVLEANTPAEIGRAVDAFLAEEEMPQDPELLVKILAHPKGNHAREALDALLELLEKGKPSNARLLKTRVQGLKIDLDDPDIDTLADAALALL